jgi:hypothetical protein
MKKLYLSLIFLSACSAPKTYRSLDACKDKGGPDLLKVRYVKPPKIDLVWMKCRNGDFIHRITIAPKEK